MSAIRTFLEHRCAAGPWQLGQLWIDGFTVRHAADRAETDLTLHQRPEDAREIAKYDDAGAYRPLKTAPNLRRGWELRLASVPELQLALDFFYPAAIGTWLAHGRDELPVVPLRETLGRQTGMYRVTQLIRDDQATVLIEKMCVAGCLRRRLWEIGASAPIADRESEKWNPDLVCAEACNLLVAACRPLAKENLPPANAPA